MASITPDEIAIPEIATSHSRREALKRFGRYAAAAPAVMVLLEPSVGHAGKGKGRGWGQGGRWGKGGGSHY